MEKTKIKVAQIINNSISKKANDSFVEMFLFNYVDLNDFFIKMRRGKDGKE